jgi:hypothetical protein
MLINFNQLPRKIIGLTHEISICKKLLSAYYAEFPVSEVRFRRPGITPHRQ